jgi:osmoprotectant transport system permease protein
VNWFLQNFDLVLELTLNHIRLSIIPIVLGFLIAVPLGRLTLTGRAARGTIITVTSLAARARGTGRAAHRAAR